MTAIIADTDTAVDKAFRVEASRRLNYIYRSTRSERRGVSRREKENIIEEGRENRQGKKGRPVSLGSSRERKYGARAIATTKQPPSFPLKAGRPAVVIIARESITAAAGLRRSRRETRRKDIRALANSRRLSSGEPASHSSRNSRFFQSRVLSFEDET